MKKVFFYLKPYLGRMSLGLTIKFTGTIMDLLLPWILSYLIDEIIPKKNISLVLLYGFYMLVCSLIAWITNIVANRMASLVARNTTERIRHDLYARISYLSSRQTDEFTIPSLESRLTTDTYNIHQMLGMMQRLGVRAPILLLGGICVTLTLEPVLTLVLLLSLPFVGGVVFYISRKGIPLFTKQQQAIDKMTRKVRESASGIRVIKALSKTEYEKESFREINEDLVRKETHASKTMAASSPLMNLFLNLGLTLVIVVGAYRVYIGASKAGVILAFLTYFTIILNALLSINRMFMLYSKGAASANRISEVLDTPEDLGVMEAPEASEASEPEAAWKQTRPEAVRSETRSEASEASASEAAWKQTRPEVAGPEAAQNQETVPVTTASQKPAPKITFSHVSFSYHGSQNALTDIDFTLEKGQTLGIIGATGSGKTTLIKLLLRLYDPTEGTILVEGRDLRSIPTEELYQKFGVVFQNDFLYADTLAENIRFGRELSADQLTEAVRDAQAYNFIHNIPDGMDHELAVRGSNLSGGQKQRVLISRALAARPEILILDDASSALDYKTDAALRKAIRTHLAGCTSVIIAQRISSIQYADLILMLENGHIIGAGTHSQLMESCPPYREIADAQMGGLQE